jgi:hypothetical protein
MTKRCCIKHPHHIGASTSINPAGSRGNDGGAAVSYSCGAAAAAFTDGAGHQLSVAVASCSVRCARRRLRSKWPVDASMVHRARGVHDACIVSVGYTCSQPASRYFDTRISGMSPVRRNSRYANRARIAATSLQHSPPSLYAHSLALPTMQHATQCFCVCRHRVRHHGR